MSRNEGKIGPQDHTPNQNFPNRNQLLEPLHGADFSTMPFPHITYLSAGGVAEICRLNCMVWRLPRDRLIVAFSKAASVFSLSTKRHSTSDNSCYTSSFGHANRAMSIISMSLRYDPVWLGVACRTHRLVSNILYFGGWRGP